MIKKIISLMSSFVLCMTICNITPTQAYASVLPPSVDLSTSDFFPDIGYQGSVGSCVAWSTTYYQFTYEVNKFKNEPTTEENVYSPAWTYNYINGGGSGIVQPQMAYDVLARQGAMKLVDFPCGTDKDTYAYTEWSSDIPKMAAALEYRAEQYGRNAANSNNLTDVKTELSKGKVGVIVTDTNDWVIKETADGEDIVVCGSGGRNHAVAVVGYDDSIVVTVNDEKLTGAFKLANSWGENFGNQGYIWVAYDALNPTSLCDTAWEDDSARPLETYDGKTHTSASRGAVFTAGNAFNFINIHHCPVTFAGCVEYHSSDPYSVYAYVNEANSIANLAWDNPAGPTMTSNVKRFMVFDFFQFDTDSSTGEKFYEGDAYDMSNCLASNWSIALYDLNLAAVRMRAKVIDNLGNVVEPKTSVITQFDGNKASVTIPVNLAKGRVTAYDNAAITSDDSQLVLSFLTLSAELSYLQVYLADYNSDGKVSMSDVVAMNSDIAARNGETYAITDYIDEWGCSLADVIEEQYDMPIEQYVAQNYAELSALNAIPADMNVSAY